ncbi:hypothetical protein ACJX0J_042556, partial [Zea mays]
DFNKQENVVRYMIVTRLAKVHDIGVDMTNIDNIWLGRRTFVICFKYSVTCFKEFLDFKPGKNATGFFISIFIMYQNNIWRGLHEHNHYLDKNILSLLFFFLDDFVLGSDENPLPSIAVALGLEFSSQI